jgi:hypothetical protein
MGSTTLRLIFFILPLVTRFQPFAGYSSLYLVGCTKYTNRLTQSSGFPNLWTASWGSHWSLQFMPQVWCWWTGEKETNNSLKWPLNRCDHKTCAFWGHPITSRIPRLRDQVATKHFITRHKVNIPTSNAHSTPLKKDIWMVMGKHHKETIWKASSIITPYLSAYNKYLSIKHLSIYLSIHPSIHPFIYLWT